MRWAWEGGLWGGVGLGEEAYTEKPFFQGRGSHHHLPTPTFANIKSYEFGFRLRPFFFGTLGGCDTKWVCKEGAIVPTSPQALSPLKVWNVLPMTFLCYGYVTNEQPVVPRPTQIRQNVSALEALGPLTIFCFDLRLA